MPKKLISVRLEEELIEKMDICREDDNYKSVYYTRSRRYYSPLYGYISRADIIEDALREYFEKKKI